MMRPIEHIIRDRLNDAEMRRARAARNLRNKAAYSYESGRVDELRNALRLLEQAAASAAPVEQ
jgi:hypothetical protein